MRTTVLCTMLAALAACQPVDRRRQLPPPPPEGSLTADTVAPAPQAPPPANSRATKVATVVGFLTPESVLDDSAQDIYFVSNINGSPLTKDNNGFISRLRPDGAIEVLKFIEGGRGGVTLNAPKGLAVLSRSLPTARSTSPTPAFASTTSATFCTRGRTAFSAWDRIVR